MKIDKFNLVDFKSIEKEDFFESTDATLEASNDSIEESNNLLADEITELLTNKPQDISEEICMDLDASMLSDHSVPESNEIQNQIIDQNQKIQDSLIELRDILVTIERQQESNLLDLSKKFINFVSSMTTKLFKDIKFKAVVQGILITRVQDVISKFTDASKLKIIIPKFTEEFKKEFIDSIKTTANKLNIEITEHEEAEKKVEVSWENGKVEINIDQTLDEINEEVKKIDTIS